MIDSNETVSSPMKAQKEQLEQAPVVDMSLWEYVDCFNIGVGRTVSYLEHGGDHSMNGSLIEKHFHGVVGEYAFSKHYGIDIDDEFYHGGDSGGDFEVGGQTVDIKLAVGVSHPYLLEKEYKEPKDVYVLCHANPDRTITILGWIRGEELYKGSPANYPRKKGRDFKNRIARWDTLNPMPDKEDEK